MASSAHIRAPPRAQRSTRKKSSYRELTSDEEVSDVSPIKSQPVAKRSSRRVQRRSYKEDEDSSDASQSTADSELPQRSPPSNARVPHTTFSARRSQRNAPAAQRKRRAPVEIASSNRSAPSTRKRLKLNKVHEARNESARQRLHEQAPVGKVTPPWQDLEYQILLQILKYAAYPLYTGASHSRPTIQWLLDVSLLSKSFHAAAIAALLHSPPLFPADRAHGLLRLLKQDQDGLSTNYRTKIRVINVEARNLLMRKSGVALQDMVGRHTPLLSELNIYHNFDLIGPTIWGRPTTSKKNWAYPPELFDALDDADIHLQAFSWNGRFPETKQVLERMPSLHERACLNSLHLLTLLNMTLPEKSSEGENKGILLTALSHLPELRELVFDNCELLNEAMLAKLPHPLRSLTLTNCAKVTSDGLGTFLQLHGDSGLNELYLKGNQAMDLGFLPALASSCPNLQRLEVDLTYTDPSSYHDVDPHYAELLPNGQPTWPPSLRVVEFANLRNLDAAEADSFFQSLVDFAPELKDLRRLSLKAILKTGWRDRARLREKWKLKLEKVFLRKPSAPRLFDPSWSKPSPRASQSKTAADSPIESQASGSRIASSSEDSDPAGKPSGTISKNRKSSRIAQNPMASSTARSTASNGPVQRSEDNEEFVHGMVDEVILRLDDQRPAEEQWNEGDFLDSEPQSDEDWDGT